MTQASLITGNGGLPKVHLIAPDGSQAEIYLHGGHVTSWKPATTQTEQLFLSPKSEFRPGAAIRGGVPVIFPQFSMEGPLPRHGFARTSAWTFHGAASPSPEHITAQFQLSDSAATRAIWPQAFLAELTVTVGSTDLTLTLTVTNTGHTPYSFTAALHTYLQVADIADTQISPLQGLRYRDQVQQNQEFTADSPHLTFQGEVDRIYFNAPRRVHLQTRPYPLDVQLAGFPDMVIWNPGAVKGAALADMDTDSYRYMVCIEGAAIAQPIPLAPQESWQGAQTITLFI